jgi:hypothetical protein
VLKSPKNNPLTFGQRLAALRVITYASARLEKLQRTKLLLRGPGEDWRQQVIGAALDELGEELGRQL